MAAEPLRRAAVGWDAPANLACAFVDNRITTSRYHAYNFVFVNLREQFRRKANFYFLVISLLMILGWYMPRLFQSSINPWGTLGTLLFVLGVTMVKEGVEDKARHRADRRENNSPVRALRHGKRIVVRKQDLRVGDYVLVKNREQFPADLICMASADLRGQCFVETSNIDGETNLKIRKVPQVLVDANLHSFETLPTDGSFECEAPNKDIHNFRARLQVSGSLDVPVAISNFLLRGSVLRNTPWIMGLVVYTGEDTKIMRNRGNARSKLSKIERTVNRLIVIVFITQFLLVVLSVIVNAVYSKSHQYDYIGSQAELILPQWLGNFFTFYILYSNFVPISLYVTMEMVNLLQAVFIQTDLDMYHEEEDVAAVCRNSTLCQELGQVEYIFSDKTGTLTCNLMEFKKASVDGVVHNLDSAVDAIARRAQPVVDLFQLLAVCHTVVPDREGEAKELAGIVCPAYEAESPDEAALVEAAARVGIRFFDRNPDTVVLKEFGPLPQDGLRDRQFKILAVNEFSSARKRMSIVVEDDGGEIIVLCKGADNVMFELCSDGVTDVLNRHLTDFAEEGLRTLVCAQRTLSRAEFDEWIVSYKAAQLTVNQRGEALAKCAAQVERDMKIVGATAIEDKLQDQVPETLEDLKKAGIKVWVLTGDKLETAVNIGYSCRLLNASMRVVTIATDTAEEAREQLMSLDNVISISKDPKLLMSFQSRVEQLISRVLPSRGRKRSNESSTESSHDKGVPVAPVHAGESSESTTMGSVREDVRDNDALAASASRIAASLVSSARFRRGSESNRDSSRSVGVGNLATLESLGSSDGDSHEGIALNELNGGENSSMAGLDTTMPRPDLEAGLAHGSARSAHRPAMGHGADEGTTFASFIHRSRPRKHAVPRSQSEPPAPIWATAARIPVRSFPKSDLPSGRNWYHHDPEDNKDIPAAVNNEASTDHLALVIDGKTLGFVLHDPELANILLHVGRVCKAVIACRVSPAQKAEVVSLVKKGDPGKPITLAIGDGANDVTMIQQASLGVGISGREGRQAVNASDFAIGQFRFLRKLLLVHGRNNYRRMSKVILVCFYKNICLVFTLFIYSFFTLMSGTSTYDSWIYAGFNWFSGMPPVLVGIFDADISAAFLLSVPALYESGRNSAFLNLRTILQWIFRAATHALVCALIPIFLALSGAISQDVNSLYAFGSVMYTGILFTVLAIIGLETSTWNGFHWFFYPASVALYIVVTMLFSAVPSYTTLAGVGSILFKDATIWVLAVILVPSIAYLSELCFKHLALEYWPTLADIGAEVDNGKSEVTPEQFKAEVEQNIEAKMMSAQYIETVLESTYSSVASERTRSSQVARNASSVQLVADF